MNTLNAVMWLAEKKDEFDPNKVTPGVEGFIFTGAMAVLVIVLGFLLVSRLRRNQYRHEVRDQIEAELAEQGTETPDADDTERQA